MRATQAYFEATGGPEVIQWREVDLPAPGAGEILVRHEAVGLNYIDTYFRSGLYPAALPSGIGMEAAGIVEAVGDGVSHDLGRAGRLFDRADRPCAAVLPGARGR